MRSLTVCVYFPLVCYYWKLVNSSWMDPPRPCSPLNYSGQTDIASLTVPMVVVTMAPNRKKEKALFSVFVPLSFVPGH